MKIPAKNTSKQSSPEAIKMGGQSQSAKSTSQEMMGNRSQIDMQSIADNSPRVNRSARLKAIVSPKRQQVGQLKAKHDSPVQLVLKAGMSAATEARHIAAYHASERAGDGLDRLSRNADHHRRAIAHYRTAIGRRQQANSMHVAPDQGHLDAIGVLRGKIQGREGIIRQIEQRQAAQARARAAMAAAAVAPAAGGGGGFDFFRRTGEASFLEGNQSAWQPRKAGT